MLASFESFLETVGHQPLDLEDEDDGAAAANFDGSDQTEDSLEREGVDVHELNGLARSYRDTFGRELPHPKMDALAERLSTAWHEGRKELVFVRRVRSVDELRARLDDAYDEWLFARLDRELPSRHRPALERVRAAYVAERRRRHDRRVAGVAADADADDPGGI